VTYELKPAVLNCPNIAGDCSHRRVVEIESGLNCWRRIIPAPYRIGKRDITAGTQQSIADTKGILQPNTIESTLGPDEIEAFVRQSRPGHISDNCMNPMRESARVDGSLKPFDAWRVTVNCHDTCRGKFSGKVKSLATYTAAKVEDLGMLRKLTAEPKGFDGTIAIARTLAWQVLVDLKKNTPKAGRRFVHDSNLV